MLLTGGHTGPARWSAGGAGPGRGRRPARDRRRPGCRLGDERLRPVAGATGRSARAAAPGPAVRGTQRSRPVELAQEHRIDLRPERLEQLEIEDRDPGVGLGRVDPRRRRTHRVDRVASRGLAHAEVSDAHGSRRVRARRVARRCRVVRARLDESHDLRSGSASRVTAASLPALRRTLRCGDRGNVSTRSPERSTRRSDALQRAFALPIS